MTQSRLPVPQGALSTYLVEINRFPLLSADEEHRLAVRYYETGDVEAAHALVTSNLRFVVKIACEYRSYGIRMADLIQEGNIGLMQAVKKFNPYKGYRLISYGVWWIRAMIQSYILKSWSLVKIGTTQAQRKLFYKLAQTKRRLANFLSDSPNALSDEARHSVAETLHVRDEDVAEMDARMKGRDASLDQPVHADSQITPMDMLASADNQEDLLANQEKSIVIRAEVNKALMSLSDKEKYIIEKRLMTDEPLTLQEIGNQYRISRERARQIEERAKQKIRLALATSTATKECF